MLCLTHFFPYSLSYDRKRIKKSITSASRVVMSRMRLVDCSNQHTGSVVENTSDCLGSEIFLVVKLLVRVQSRTAITSLSKEMSGKMKQRGLSYYR